MNTEKQTAKRENVWKRIPYGNYTFNLTRDGSCYVTRFGQYVGTFGNARIAENYVNSLINQEPKEPKNEQKNRSATS
jgi:hypothetical protein